MTAEQWFFQLLLGGLLGMVGQGIRVVIGLKKVTEQAQQKGILFSDLFQAEALLVSLLIGFVAGTLAILGLSDGSGALAGKKETLLALVGAGYAGTDFIEGFIKRYLPSKAEATGETDVFEQDRPAVG
jgi:hypothetical protein